MKTDFLKISFLILVFSLVIGAALAVMASAGSETTKTPEIVSQNITYSDKFALMYAVKADTVTDVSDLKLCIYEEDPSESDNIQPARTYTRTYLEKASNNNNLKYDSYIFPTDGISAVAMDKVFYAQAVEGNKKSEVIRYSVAEYLYQRLDSEDVTSAQLNFYNSTLEFGAAAQAAIAGETDETKYITNYCYVTVINGTLNGTSYSKGLYPAGTAVTPSFADNAALWNVISYYKNSYPEKISTSEAYTIKAGVKSLLLTTEDSSPYRKDIDKLDTRTSGTKYTLSYTGSAASNWKPNFSDGIFASANGNPTMEYVSEAGHGIVGKFSFSYGQRPVIINTDTYDAETDTAIEFSFDMKLNSPSASDKEEFQLWMIDSNNAAKTEAWNYSIRSEGADSAGLNIAPSVNPRDWFHIRFVIYESDPTKCRFYVNGEYVYEAASTFASIKDAYGLIFVQYSDSSNPYNAYFDNIYVGYTTDTLPES